MTPLYPKSILPETSTAFERAWEQIGHVRVLEGLAVEGTLGQLYAIAQAPSGVLDHLAAGFGLDPWNVDWPDSRKRQALQALYVTQAQRGTLASVREAVKPFGEVNIIEWFDQSPQGSPYTFIAQVSSGGLDQLQMRAAIERVMPVRCRFTIEPRSAARGDVVAVGALYGAKLVTLTS